MNVNAPQRIEVPLTTLTMKLDLRAAGQILTVSQGSNVSVREAVPVLEVTTEGGRATIVPGLGWLLPIPFYFMELLVGIVQAMVFMLLTAVFTLLICHHEEAGPAATGE